MAVKILKDAAKETAKKARAAQRKRRKADQNKPSSNSQSGQPEPGTRGARKPKPKVSPKTQTRNKTAPKAKPKSKAAAAAEANRARQNVKIAAAVAAGAAARRADKIRKAKIAAAAAAAAAGTGVAVNRARNRKSSGAAKVSFGDAFKKARKEGEGTKFTWNGKSYTAVTKDDLKKKGYDGNELKQYANNKGKARRPIKRIGQGIKKVLLGKDKKFGGDKGLIDFIRGPKSKAKAKAKQGTANKKQTVRVNLRGGGMATGTSRSRVTPGQKSAIFRGRPDMPKIMPDGTRGGVLDLPELTGQRGPGMKKGGMAVKKYKAGGLAKRGLGKAYMKSKR